MVIELIHMQTQAIHTLQNQNIFMNEVFSDLHLNPFHYQSYC